MAESIPEKDQFLIAYPNYVLRETVTYPNGGVSRFYDDGVDMVIIDDENLLLPRWRADFSLYTDHR
jgi:hypothetical protein